MIRDATTSIRPHPMRLAAGAILSAAAILMVGVGWASTPAGAAELMKSIPALTAEEPAPQADTEVAVLAGGCFWGVQGVYQHVEGVSEAVSGYAGGAAETARYRMVGTNSTGHAESVRIVFDPRRVSFGKLLQIFFSVAHDPTELNRQGPDTGTQYRSAVFPTSAEQAQIAAAYIEQLNKAKVFETDIVTTIEPDRAFYRAEQEHQDFLTRHPLHPYIIVNDLPKVAGLERVFPDLYRAEPVLVSAEKSTK